MRGGEERVADVVVTNGGRQAWLHKGVSSFWITWRMDNFIYIYAGLASLSIRSIDGESFFRGEKRRNVFASKKRRGDYRT